VQIPLIAGRDAWRACSGEEGSTKLLLPVWFVVYSFEHAGLGALHLVDLAASPIHVIVGNPPAPIYEPWTFPLREIAPEGTLGKETGHLALYGIAGVGGAVIAWWYTTIFIPHLFAWLL
jgi:hypothetical protein